MDRPKYFVSTPGKLDEYRIRRHFPALQRFGQGSGQGSKPTETSKRLKLKGELVLKKPQKGTFRFKRLSKDNHAKDFSPYIAKRDRRTAQTGERIIDKRHWEQEDFSLLSDVRTRIIMQPSKARNLPPADPVKADERATRKPWAGSNRVEAREAISRHKMLAPREPYSGKLEKDREARRKNKAGWLNQRGFIAAGSHTKRNDAATLFTPDGNAELTAELQFYRMKAMELRRTESGRAAARANQRRSRQQDRETDEERRGEDKMASGHTAQGTSEADQDEDLEVTQLRARSRESTTGEAETAFSPVR